jgi:putative ABC transport system substrate-binding protein
LKIQNRKSLDDSAERAGAGGQGHKMRVSSEQRAVSSKRTERKQMTTNILVFFCLLLTVPLPTGLLEAQQQAKKIPRIGFLTSASALDRDNPNLEAFRRGLRDLGWVEGQTLHIEYRWAEGKNERLPDLAAELAHLKVELIVTTGGTATNAAKQATKTIPIVFMQVGNPDRQGFVASLARPGGNITGLSNIAEEISGKRLELLKETFPKLSRVAVLWDPSTGPHSLRVTEKAARLLDVRLQILEVREIKDFDGAFRAASKGLAEAATVLSSGVSHTHRETLVDSALKKRFPAVFDHRNYVEAGGLISYGPDVPEMFRRGAIFVDKILKGTKPADLPVEQPTKFELVINLKTAKQIGLTIPPNVLARADRVIR